MEHRGKARGAMKDKDFMPNIERGKPATYTGDKKSKNGSKNQPEMGETGDCVCICTLSINGSHHFGYLLQLNMDTSEIR